MKVRTLPILSLLLICTDQLQAQIPGCTDKAAINYNSKATVNNGSCRYDTVSIATPLKYQQQDVLKESSGMVWWDSLLWQHNDGGGMTALYATDTSKPDIVRSVRVLNAYNLDWEDMAQDESNLYVGDFGNNANGARKNFRIYKMPKAEIEAKSGNSSVSSSVIQYRYEDQPEIQLPGPSDATDLDCEAMIAFNGKLYLFTKQWKSQKTVVYRLDTLAGEQVAKRMDSLDVQGLVTGADIHPSTGRIILTGYTKLGRRFLYLLYGFKGDAFFSGNKRKVWLKGIAQTESVAFIDGENIFISSEAISILKPTIEKVNLTRFF